MNSDIEKAIKQLEAAIAILKEQGNESGSKISTVKVGDLEWQADVPAEEFTWEEAKDYAASLGDGWRLPTIQELLSLVDYTKNSPACSVFPNCPSDWFWSSSPVSGDTAHAWFVSFSNGDANDAGVSAAYRVRCVR